MNSFTEKLTLTCENLRKKSRRILFNIDNLEYVATGYKRDCPLPETGWKPYTKGTKLTATDGHFYLRSRITVPKADENTDAYLIIKTGREGQWDATNPQCLVYLNGEMIQGFDTNHVEMFIDSGKTYDLLIYYYSGPDNTAIELTAALETVDTRIEKLYYDLMVPLEASQVSGVSPEDTVKTTVALEQAANMIDFREEGSEAYFKSIAAADEYLETEYYGKVCGKNDSPVVNCIGHTHIDVEWRWTRWQTMEKVQRSFSTAIHLMNKYPEYRFMLSQPQLYQYLKDEAPEKYNEIKQLVKEGRWEPEGAMWLEADCNLSSGESLIRQIIKGKRFFKDEFGVDSKVLWLPDVFGYSAALPQILKMCGVEYFVTSKISWNDINMMPYDSFYWEGIDGSEIFTYFITNQNMPKDSKPTIHTSYNGTTSPLEIKGTWNRYQQKEFNDRAITAYGYGDGGGGPTREMLERQRRLCRGIPGIPRTESEFVYPFLCRVKQNFDANAAKLKRRPKWVGELYLEYHRGTYTSIAKNKLNNRQSEYLLTSAETLSVMANKLLGSIYRSDDLHAAWALVLHNQFHDIIPGTSIKEVYEDTDRDYEKVRAVGGEIIAERLSAIAANVKATDGLVVYNPTGFQRNGTLCVDGQTVEVMDIPALGWKVVHPKAPNKAVSVQGRTAENQYYRLTLDNCGRIESLFDKKAGREVFKPGAPGNELQVFEDYAATYSAWEIRDFYKQKMWIMDDDAQVTPVFDGARAGFKISHTYLSSTLEQYIYLYDTNRRIDFVTTADWHNKHQLLKVAFPFDIHTSTATYEIQFGHLERPTHSNTSWETAKFEVCGHKWADMSDSGYGVSILNNCKYGYSAEGSTMKLTLIKCSDFPNPEADDGFHEFTYSLLPHCEDFRKAGVVQEAYCLNQPLLCKEVSGGGALPDEYSFVSADSPNMIIETIKKAEDSDAVILRMYEAFDRKGKVTLNLNGNFRQAWLCDMLENELCPLDVKDSKLELPYQNFEILTIKLQ